MWEDILQEVIDLKMQFGDQINPGATDEDMKKWLLACKTELNKEIPDEYLQFLKKINGIEFDGFILYGIDLEYVTQRPEVYINGLISNNKDWADISENEYLFIGDSSISWYVYGMSDEKYYELDKPSGDVIGVFESCNDLLEKVLSDMA